MHTLKRIGYYLGGFSIGLVLLAFFFSGKKTSCAYFPQERVLKNLRVKPYNLTPGATQSLASMQLDTVTINRLLKLGDVDFGESVPRREPCGHYVITGQDEAGNDLKMELDNCKEAVNIKSLTKITN
ncbi:hypothetical protein JM84_1579 [Dokdonia sp. Hel_I_63]|uniref:hypothetical protein n=1 Tax=Dokdonia sp. Hel_I_63 TaxID=1249996 RepID=UPI00119BB7AE|nr:hypothetical protein [Dokdonia sp. Hel_I_63]TVZ22669.1 hypothetical protein JM84_1579 [Dokdonia sp. Hel_I_63]